MATINPILKPFVINQTDIQFILDQLNFLPLFDANPALTPSTANIVINWDGTGTVYDSKGNAFVGGVVAGDAASLQAIADHGYSYASVVDLAGLRDPSGLNNNLSLINNSWGSVDQIFTRSAAVDYSGYSPIMQGVATAAYYAAKYYYASYAAGGVTGNTFSTTKTDYTISNTFDGTHHAVDGTPITVKNVVDYTPRMISLTTTTAGVTFDTWANHSGDLNAANHTANEIYYTNGVATVTDWGQLETVALGGQGQVDTQARLAASAGQNDHFIGGLNPGVSPSNGFFVLFGQFFDHGLDFIDKGGQGATIKIALAADDPLYGMLGADGQPVHEITINRATVQTVDANGAEYTNHTSPYIDQSQTYGSHEQLTTLLREWVKDPATGNFHAGMNMFDGNTLDTAWIKADGVTKTNATLPTLNELSAAIVATGRAALTWEDVLDLRNRDMSTGALTTGTSGSALLLDMNPRFDAAHLYASTGFNDANHNGVLDGTETSYSGFIDTNHNGVKDGAEQTQVQIVNAAIATLHNYVASGAYQATRPGDTFDMVGGKLTLHLATPLVAGPSTIPMGDYTGANAMMQWVNFGNMSIISPASIHSAVSDILMASVGDHYIAGDGRVNENFGLTSIHHVFHEEHNYQVQNLMDALHKQDLATNDVNHDKLHEFQINANGGHMNAEGDYTTLSGQITWDMDKVFNGAKLIVEMEYQHAAVDQYARNVTPNIQEFGAYSTGVNSAVSLEYAQSAFRFGHSTLRETIDTIDPTHGLTGKIMGYALKEAFLSPEKFADVGAASILLGMTHQQMNEVDEFVTPALNQGLLGQPLDLAAINIARGRDLGLPTLNDLREAIGYAKYTSWNDFGQNMQHPSSLANFIAAYSFDGDLDKGHTIVDLADGMVLTTAEQTIANDNGWTASTALDFLNGGNLDFNLIDSWLGGLAEIHQPGGILGETFDKVFVDQIEKLMDGDRFYYLYRLAGQNLGDEVGNAQLKDIVERNTGLTHLNGNIFGYQDQYIDLGAHRDTSALSVNGGTAATIYDTTVNATTHMLDINSGNTVSNEHKYGDNAAVDTGVIGVYSNGGHGNANDGMDVVIGGKHYILDTRLADANAGSAYDQNGGTNLDGTPNSGAESNEIIVGSKGDDLVYAQGGDDTVYGDGGNDIIWGGYGIDRLYGGAGADTIHGGDNPDLIDGGSGDDELFGDSSGTDINGLDQLVGGSGNDTLHGGMGIDKLSGGSGDDKIYGDQDTDPATHGGDGNDYVDGGSGTDVLYGDNGDDIISDGTDVDISFGGAGDDILQVGDIAQALGAGPDEVLGGDGITDDGNVAGTIGFDMVDFSLQIARNVGNTYTLGIQNNPLVAVNAQQIIPASFQLEGVIGSQNNDVLEGSNIGDAALTGNLAQFDMGENWIIGGSGNDLLSGLGGNDVIVGGSIRLDSLIGKYSTNYDHNNNNDGLTNADQLMDARYQGASHRVAYNDVLTGGVLSGADTAEFAKHYTEMLRSLQFKDVVLGDNKAVANGALDANGGNDTVLYSGRRRDYTVVAVDKSGNVLADPNGVDAANFYAVKIHDTRGLDAQGNVLDADGAALVDANGLPVPGDGTDLVIGVKSYQFADKTVDVNFLFNHKPTGSIGFNETDAPTTGFGGGATQVLDQPNAVRLTGTQALFDVDNISATNPTGAVQNFGAGVTYTWTDNANAALPTTNTSNPYVDNQGRIVLHTTSGTGTVVKEIVTYVDGGGTTESVTKTWNMVVGTSGDNAALNGTASLTVDDSIFGLAGNDTLNGLAGNDRLYGGAGNDTLNGGDGNDYLDGGSGINSLRGGAGDDTYVVASATDTVDESVYVGNIPTANSNAGGVDTVLSSITYTLGANLENLTLTGGGFGGGGGGGSNINGTGNTLNNVLTGNNGNNTLDGAGGTDTAAYSGAVTAFSAGINATGNVTLTSGGGFGGGTGTDTLISIENVKFGTNTYNLVKGSNAADVVVNGTGGADYIVAGRGDDTVSAGSGDDVIVWTATGTNNGNAVLDGRDIVDGGANASLTSMGDTFVVNGNNQVETFNVYTRADWLAIAGNVATQLAAGTEIIVARNGLTNANIIGELANVEEIRINTGGGNDTVNVSGNFNATHLNYNTVSVDDGGSGTVTVNASHLTSAHHIALYSTGGDDTIVGKRAQDVIIANAAGSTGTGDTGSTGGGTTSGDHNSEPEVCLPHADSNAGSGTTASGGTGGTTPAPTAPAAPGDQNLLGDATANVLAGGDGNNTIAGLAGEDLISSGNGNNNVIAGEGGDTIVLGNGNNHVDAGLGADNVFLGNGTNWVSAGAGDDTVFGGTGNTTFVDNGNDGNDTYHGGGASDTLDMSAISARIEANLGTGYAGWAKVGTETNHLYGIENIATGSGDDTITASDAHNTIDVGDHSASGHDTVIFRTAASADGDNILNFQTGDKIDLHNMMNGTINLVSTAASAHDVAVQFDATTHGDSIITGIDEGGNHFTIDVKGHHVIGTDFAA